MIYGYTRVSTAEQGDEGHSLGAQREAIRLRYPGSADTDGITYVEDIASASTLERPGLGDLLDRITEGDTLVVAKLDRISRSVIDWCGLVERANDEGWTLVALDFNLDTGSVTGRFVATIMMAFSEMERELISERTKAGLAEARRKGVRLGRPSSVSEETRVVIADLRAAGLTQTEIATSLDALGHTAPEGGQWTQQAVSRVVRAQARAG